MANVKISALPDGGAFSDADVFPINQSGTTYKKTYQAFREGLRATERWFPIDSGDWTATPASTSRITMSDTSEMLVGQAVRYTIGGTVYYGVVSALSSNSYIDVRGASVSGTITKLEVGGPGTLATVDIVVPGIYAGSTSSTLLADFASYFRWGQRAAYVVDFQAVHGTADGTSQCKLNVLVEGSVLSTNDSNNGIQMSTAGTWVKNSAIAINTTNYSMAYGEDIELKITVADGAGESSDLTVQLTVVLP